MHFAFFYFIVQLIGHYLKTNLDYLETATSKDYHSVPSMSQVFARSCERYGWGFEDFLSHTKGWLFPLILCYKLRPMIVVSNEPPYTVPYVRWCERTGAEKLPPTRFWTHFVVHHSQKRLKVLVQRDLACQMGKNKITAHLLSQMWVF